MRKQTSSTVTNMGYPKSDGAEGVSGATADFVCFHCPRLASAEAKPFA